MSEGPSELVKLLEFKNAEVNRLRNNWFQANKDLEDLTKRNEKLNYALEQNTMLMICLIFKYGSKDQNITIPKELIDKVQPSPGKIKIKICKNKDVMLQYMDLIKALNEEAKKQEVVKEEPSKEETPKEEPPCPSIPTTA